MGPNNLLRKQVVTEMKKRRLIFFTFVLVAFFYVAVTLIFDNMGLRKYMELNKRKAYLENQIKVIEKRTRNSGQIQNYSKKIPFIKRNTPEKILV